MTTHETIQPFNLDDFKELFVNAEAFAQFVESLEKAFHRTGIAFVLSGRLLGVSVSPQKGKQLICDSLIKHWLNDPSALLHLEKAMKVPDEDLVDP